MTGGACSCAVSGMATDAAATSAAAAERRKIMAEKARCGRRPLRASPSLRLVRLHGDGEALVRLPAKGTPGGGHVRVVPADRNLDVRRARDEIVRGIEASPSVHRRVSLGPRVRRLGVDDRAAGLAAVRRDGVAAHVARRNAELATETDEQVREVLADAGAMTQHLFHRGGDPVSYTHLRA